MIGQTETPMQEIIASGLHRLAQPISSALWSVELADQPEIAPLPHVAGEMRRAAGILHVLRSLIEAHANYPENQPENLNLLLAQVHQDVAAQLSGVGLQCHAAMCDQPVMVQLNAQGFVESYRLLLEKFLWMNLAPGVISETLTVHDGEFVLKLRCDSPAIALWSKAEREKFLQELDPFDTPGFDFSSRTAPELTQARAILASASIDLHADVEGAAILITLQGSPCKA